MVHNIVCPTCPENWPFLKTNQECRKCGYYHPDNKSANEAKIAADKKSKEDEQKSRLQAAKAAQDEKSKAENARLAALKAKGKW